MPALNMMFQEKPSTPQFRKETTILPAAAAQAYNRLYVAGSRRPFQAVRISYAAGSDNSSVVQRCGSDSEDDTIKDPDYGEKNSGRSLWEARR